MKGSPVQPTVNTHTSAQHVSNPILNSNVGEAKTTNMATKPPHPNLVYLKQSTRNNPPQPLPTPIKYDRLAFYLLGYDQNKVQYLLNGFKHGFNLEFEGKRGSQFSPNLKSALEKKEIVTGKIIKELTAGRIAGPFSEPPFPSMKISPLGIVPKKTPNDFRMIHHLSFPNKKEGSVNAGISDASAFVQYAGINDAISCIKDIGDNAFCCKTDIRSAFRILPVSPNDYELLGFYWEDKYYFDKCLPMGCRTSCKIFEEFSTAIEWIARNKLGITHVVHILDDFLFIENSKSVALEKFKLFLHMCADIGIPLASDKTVLPTQVIEFVGITIDVNHRESRLPQDKIEKCKRLLTLYQQTNRCSVKDMQSLIGVLNFACSVIMPGRAFLRRLIQLTLQVSENQEFITISKECKDDMALWLVFLDNHNGKTMFLDEKFISSHALHLYTDAAQSKGFAGIYKTQYFFGSFPEHWKEINIMTLEFYPILLSVVIWGKLWANHSILFFTDNEALVSVINKQTSRDSLVMLMVRFMVLHCLNHNIVFRAKHIPGKNNVLADSLSRLQVTEFRRLAPNAQKYPTCIPDNLKPENFWRTLQTLQSQL